MVPLLRIAAATGAIAILAASALAQVTGVAVLSQAVAATQAVKADYAFDFELDSSKTDWRARFDPDTTPRLQLISPQRQDLNADQRRAFDRMAEDFEGVAWCAGERMGRVAGVQLVREDDTTATYSFQPTRESIRSEQVQRFADQLRGEMVMTKDNPDITRVRIYTPEGFSPAPLVRIDRFTMTIACQTAPNGRRYAAETIVDIQGSALGQNFSERTVQRQRNLSAP